MEETKEVQTIEKIGNITLDLSRYPGEDFYCDGKVEDEILSIVKNLSPVEYARAIEEKKSWPVLYHLSPLRENIVDWLPMDKQAKVLEVGSGCGAITGALARKAGSVTCVDLSKKRSMINAYRHAECDNVTIHVGNFKDIEPDLPRDFDYICLIGVFEYAQSYIGGKTPFHDFLKILLPHLAEGGRLVIAIENKYGMKYFAGCKEDHLGTWFSGIENYAEGGGVRTFGKKTLSDIFTACGLDTFRFFYPYPDYKFMDTLFSDNRLPGKGELSNNLRNYDRDRMLLFDEKNAFDGILEEGMFPFFSNSYIAVIGPDFDVDYVRYSNDRAPEYAIRTQIGRREDGTKYVRKYPCSQAAEGHIAGLQGAYEGLKERYEGSSLSINTCELVQNDEVYAEFEFVEGKPLTELLDACLECGDIDGFHNIFDKYLETVGYNEEFPVADFDLIFANLLVQDDSWTLIDYEWTFGQPIETKEVAFRAIYCYIMENEKRNKLELDRILEKLAITEQDAEAYRAKEADFQAFVTGKQIPMTAMRDLIGYRMMVPQKWIEKYKDSENVNRVQVYEDLGKGFNEESAYFVKDAFLDDNHIEMTLTVSGSVQTLRIDPCFDSCVVSVKELLFNGEPIPYTKRKQILINGRIAKPSTLIFPTVDPNILIPLTGLERKAENTLYAQLEVTRVPLQTAVEMANSVKKIF